MYLGKADVNTYDKGTEREFLISAGTGSYGSSTVVGANTRGGHGLLVTRPHGSEQHTVLISKMEETLTAHNKKYQLSTNRYKDLVYPDGYRYVQEYQGTPFPQFTFVIHSIFLRKSIFMPQSGTCTIIKYELAASPEQISIDIRPLLAHRSQCDLVSADKKPEFSSNRSPEGAIVSSGRGHTSCISFTSCSQHSFEWSDKPLWFENLVYERDGSPDAPSLDCLWSPGFGSIKMNEGDTVYVVLSEQPVAYTAAVIRDLEKETAERMRSFVNRSGIRSSHSVLQDMLHNATHLVADNPGSEPAVYSGFPSAREIARDTFISLPGLALATGRHDTAHAILSKWLNCAAACGDIMPASIDSTGKPQVGDVDAGLWFVYAAEKYSSEVSIDFAKENFEKIMRLIKKYIDGDDALGAHMDSATGLLKYTDKAGARHWMSGDASGEQIVERKGFLVEVNALWYNALCFIKAAADAAGCTESAAKCAEIAEKVEASFVQKFWNASSGYLYDWVDPDTGAHDDAIRPNAILAVSLPHPVISDDNAKKVFTVCWNELYTTYGLRTLDPHHDKFKGKAEGRPDQKQKARLRGMAWPWLLGQFITAYIKFNPYKKDIGWMFIRPFSSHLRRGCLGGVAEYFDGTMPYRPNGDILSAISQGELLRVLHEDLV